MILMPECACGNGVSARTWLNKPCETQFSNGQGQHQERWYERLILAVDDSLWPLSYALTSFM